MRQKHSQVALHLEPSPSAIEHASIQEDNKKDQTVLAAIAPRRLSETGGRLAGSSSARSIASVFSASCEVRGSRKYD